MLYECRVAYNAQHRSYDLKRKDGNPLYGYRDRQWRTIARAATLEWILGYLHNIGVNPARVTIKAQDGNTHNLADFAGAEMLHDHYRRTTDTEYLASIRRELAQKEA